MSLDALLFFVFFFDYVNMFCDFVYRPLDSKLSRWLALEIVQILPSMESTSSRSPRGGWCSLAMSVKERYFRMKI